jgi:uncharacterized protein
MPKLILETTQMAGVPVLTICPEGGRRCPLVVFAHGMTGRKEDGIPLGYRLATAGCFCVAPDAPLHGERLDDRIRYLGRPRPGQTCPPETGLDDWYLMLELVVQAARETGALAEHLAGDPRVDAARLGVTGVSMGGYLAFYMAAHDPRVRAAAPVVGMPAWQQRWADVTLEAASYPQWREALRAAEPETEKRAAWIGQVDPFGRLPGFAPRPLLMLCGDVDSAQPKSYCVGLYRALLPAYAAQPEHLALNIVDGVGHDFTPGMMDQACDWFVRYL